MDFKNRFTQNRQTMGNRNGSFGAGSNASTNANPIANAFNTNTRILERETNRVSSQPKSGGLNKYRKPISKGTAPKGQYQKYMIEANNVFYEDRWELKELQRLRQWKWSLFLIWIVLASSYYLVGRITPYQGICPPKATCGVFVHCPDLFEYDTEKDLCVLSGDLIEEVSKFALSTVADLQYEYGEQDCDGTNNIPRTDITYLFSQLQEKDKIQHYRDAANEFFYNKKNQQDYGFEVSRLGIVTPTIKRHTLQCSAILIVTNVNNFFKFIGLIFGVVGITYVVLYFNKSRKYKSMYNYLKDKVFQASDKTINVTHALNDLEALYGPIDEDVWSKINDFRASDKKIGYYEDDFLYWKAT